MSSSDPRPALSCCCRGAPKVGTTALGHHGLRRRMPALALCAGLHLLAAWKNCRFGTDVSSIMSGAVVAHATTETKSKKSLPFFFEVVHGIVESLPPRAFPSWNNHTKPLPCLAEGEDVTSTYRRQRPRRAPTGILYVKVPKTGSSTGSSVTLRVATRIFAKLVAAGNASLLSSLPAETEAGGPPPFMCRNHFQHAEAYRLGFQHRDRERSFLWTTVRDPSRRLVSEYFHFYISRRRNNASNGELFPMYAWDNREDLPSFQVRYLSFHKLDNTNETNKWQSSANRSVSEPPPPNVTMDTIRSILNDYDFVAVSERMDESVVALQMLLGLETEDVLHLNSKIAGGYDGGGFGRRCVYIQPSFRTPEMNKFLDSPMWHRWSYWDAVLHRAANASLDLTIESLGRDRFQVQLDKYRQMQRLVNDACSSVDLVPCDASRHDLPPRPDNATGCVFKDSGCGFACIDQAILSTNDI